MTGPNKEQFKRYLSQCRTETTFLDVHFNGGVWSTDNEFRKNPSNTEVIAQYWELANPQFEHKTYIKRWSAIFGNLPMPDGSWNDIQLAEIHDDRLFVGISNRLMELDKETGRALWELETGNTPIYFVTKSPISEHLVVLNGYHGFTRNDKKSNLVAVTLDGVERWRSPNRAQGDTFCNPPKYRKKKTVSEFELHCSTWHCYNCLIDDDTGEIIDEVFTK